MAIDPIRINGNQLGWGSILAKVGGNVITGFTSIKYSDSRERVKAYGMGRHHAPRGRSPGKYQVDPVTLKGWKGSVQALREALASAAPDGISYGNVEFELVVQYVEADDKPITVHLERCVITKNTADEEESADPLSEEIEIDCMKIRRNEMTLFDSTGGAP
jgi:hypothetical protein